MVLEPLASSLFSPLFCYLSRTQTFTDWSCDLTLSLLIYKVEKYHLVEVLLTSRLWGVTLPYYVQNSLKNRNLNLKHRNLNSKYNKAILCFFKGLLTACGGESESFWLRRSERKTRVRKTGASSVAVDVVGVRETVDGTLRWSERDKEWWRDSFAGGERVSVGGERGWPREGERGTEREDF